MIVPSFRLHAPVHNVSVRHPQYRFGNSETQPSNPGIDCTPGSAETLTAQDGEGDHCGSAWQPKAASSMTRRGSWLDVEHAESAHDPDHASLLADYRPSTASDGMPLSCLRSVKACYLLVPGPRKQSRSLL